MTTATPTPVLSRDDTHPDARAWRWFLAWLLVVTALAGALRFHELDRWSLWEDELYTVRSYLNEPALRGEFRFSTKLLAYLPIGLTMDAAGAEPDEVVPPYKKEKTADEYPPAEDWRAAGINEFTMRLYPCLLGIVTVPVLALVSVRFLGVRAAAILALLLALAPWQVFWAQASRFYVQQFLFYNLALVVYYLSTRRGSAKLFIAAIVCVVIAFFSQPPALLIGFVFAADWLVSLLRREPVKLGKVQWTIIGVGAAIALALFYRELRSEGYAYYVMLEGHGPAMFVLGSLYQCEPVVLAVAGLAFIALVRRQTRLVVYLGLAATVPIVVLAALGATGAFYIHARYTFVVTFAWLALASLGLAEVATLARMHLGRAAALVPVAAACVPLLLTDLAYFTEGYGLRARWREAFEYVEARLQPGERIASSRELIATYYLQRNDLLEFPTTVRDFAEIEQPTWIVAQQMSSRSDLLYPRLHQLADLRAYFDLRALEPFSSIRVYYFDPAASPQGAPVASPPVESPGPP